MFRHAQKLLLTLFIITLVFSACGSDDTYKYTPENTPQEEETFTIEELFQETDTPKQENTQTYTVYITRTGEKYHEEYCRYLKSSKIPIELNDAKARGYTPCKVCGPPY